MIIVGHRGARKEAPENTVAGFVHAQNNGCLHFELDIQLSKDHELIVFHDTSLKRTTGERGKLGNKTYESLRCLDARLNTPYWPSPCPIPNLQNVVDCAPLTQHWQFEVKTDSRHKLTILAKFLTRFIYQNNLIHKVTVTSGDRWFLAFMQSTHPEINRGYVAEFPFPDPVATATKLGCHYLCLNDRLATQNRVHEAQNQNMHVSCWTVNNIARMLELKAFGVDSIITDIPSKALRLEQLHS